MTPVRHSDKESVLLRKPKWLHPVSKIDESGKNAEPLELLVFKMGGEEYAIDIRKVQELRCPCIANAPDIIKQALNLHCPFVLLHDVCSNFDVGATIYCLLTAAIVVNIKGRLAVLAADSISDIIKIAPEQIQPIPWPGPGPDSDYLVGLVMLGERLVVLLDIERLMSSEIRGREGRPA